MKVERRATTGTLGLVFAATLMMSGPFVGCRLRIQTTDDAGSGDDFLTTGQTLSFFSAVQIDPRSEDSAGPQFVVAGDVDGDGLLDLVSAWNESQTVQLHLQRRTAGGEVTFRTINLGGTAPLFNMAGLQLGRIGDDNGLDVVVLSRITDKACRPGIDISNVIVLFNPGDADAVTDGDRWQQMVLGNPNDATGLAVADIDGRPGDDILVAGDTVELWVNPRPDRAADDLANWDLSVQIMCGDPADIQVMDVDGDQDFDVIVASPSLQSGNVRWLRNPLAPLEVNAVTEGFGGGEGRCGGRVDGEVCECDVDCFIPDGTCVNGSCVGGATPGADCTDNSGCVGKDELCSPGPCGFFDISATRWEVRPIGHVATGSDRSALGDIDGDGFEDVIVLSTEGRIVQWFRRPPGPPIIEPEFPPNNGPTPDRFNFPWPVFTIAEFKERTPGAIAVGDLNGDGRLEVIASAAGVLLFLDTQPAPGVFDLWIENLIVDDSLPPTTDPNVEPQEVAGTTFINSILAVDLDGDGADDIVATFDRSGLSGLSNDALVWFRNTR